MAWWEGTWTGQPCVSYLTRSQPSFVSKLNVDASKEMGEGKSPNRFLPVRVTACLLLWSFWPLGKSKSPSCSLRIVTHTLPIRFFRLVSLSSQQSVLSKETPSSTEGQLYPPSSNYTNLCFVSVFFFPLHDVPFQATPPFPIHSGTEAPLRSETDHSMRRGRN